VTVTVAATPPVGCMDLMRQLKSMSVFSSYTPG